MHYNKDYEENKSLGKCESCDGDKVRGHYDEEYNWINEKCEACNGLGFDLHDICSIIQDLKNEIAELRRDKK